MAKAPKYLVSLGGDTWVDPLAVVAVDATFADGDPAWANVRVALSTGLIVFGMRAPARVAHAIRHPEEENEAEESSEVYPDRQALATDRARRRGRNAHGQPAAIREIVPET